MENKNTIKNSGSNREKKQFFVMVVNAITNVLLSIAKIAVGFMYNSQLLIADGIHSASDLLTDFFSIIGLQFAKKPKDEAHPFGHGNLEYASSLVVSVLIFFLVYELIKELMADWSVLATEVSFFVLSVSFVTFIVKLLLSWYVLYQAKKLDSHTLKSSGIESKTDAYSTIVVILGLLVTYVGLKYSITWLVYAEKVATIVVIFMLIKAASEIFYTSIVGIAGTYASDEIKEEFKDIIEEIIKLDDTNYTFDDVIVLKQGVHYALLVAVIFDNKTSLDDAAKAIDILREKLYSQEQVAKVSIEFKVIS